MFNRDSYVTKFTDMLTLRDLAESTVNNYISYLNQYKEYDRKLKEKISDFRNVTKTRSSIHLTIVTTYGLERNKYSGHVQSVVTAEDLFQPEWI